MDNPTVDTWTVGVEGRNIDQGRGQGRTNHVEQTVNLKMIAWIIQGLHKHTYNNDLLRYLQQYDIVLLCETINVKL